MRLFSIATISAFATLATGIVGCSADSSGAGSGGSSSGGAAGSSSGGSAGSSSGGSAGSVTGGSGGATGGAAGSSTGGSAGVATGGTGGGASGACTNAADQAILDDPSIDAEGKVAQCGQDNLGAEPATKNCIKQQTGLSDGCVTCFDNTIICATQNCLIQCIGGSDAQPCKDCLAQFCDGPFETCSGLSATQ